MASGSVSSWKRTSTDKVALYSLSDLPSGILAHAASFLAAPSSPSRALFAIALDENSVVTPNEKSSAIIGNNRGTLDFGDIEKKLAARLSDAYIEKVLLCVDAVNNVKRLKMTNCVAITGTCLEPLRGSVVIEQIDLSLVDDNRNSILPLSCDHVLPILDSIIERDGCALMHLRFPSMWRSWWWNERPTRSDFRTFIVRYNQMRRNQGTVTCFECDEILPRDGGEWIQPDTSSDYYGIQFHTCSGCLKHYCYVCNIDEEKKTMLHVCGSCNRDYCKGCWKMTHCSDCGKEICYDCYKYRCVKCNEEVCPQCIIREEERVKSWEEERVESRQCDYCDKCYCRGCYDDEEDDIIYKCSVRCCDDCRLGRYQRPLHCAEGMESLEQKRLQDVNRQLKAEMEELKRQNRELKLENEELKLENEEMKAGNVE